MIVPLGFTELGKSISFFMDIDEYSEPDRDMMLCIKTWGFPEPEVVRAMLQVVKPGDTVIDGGANVGFFTLLLAALVGSKGKVFACEPGDNNLEKLRANIAANKFKNITLETRALWGTHATIPFFLSVHGGHNSVNPAEHTRGKQQVNTCMLDDFQNANFIKLDIEGAEFQALIGARLQLKKTSCPYIIIELNDKQMQIRQYMETFGYDTFLLLPTGSLPVLVPPTTVIVSHDIIPTNILFSTVEKVAEAWPELHVYHQTPTASGSPITATDKRISARQ